MGNAVIRVFTAKSGVGRIPKEQDGVKIVAQVTGPINALGFASAPVRIPSVQSTTPPVPQTGAYRSFNRSSRDYCGNHRRKRKGCFEERLRP